MISTTSPTNFSFSMASAATLAASPAYSLGRRYLNDSSSSSFLIHWIPSRLASGA